MEEKEILEIIYKNIKNIKPVDNISLSYKFKEDLGFDSTDMLLLVLSLEKDFNISFFDPFIVITVDDALQFIKTKTNKTLKN